MDSKRFKTIRTVAVLAGFLNIVTFAFGETTPVSSVSTDSQATPRSPRRSRMELDIMDKIGLYSANPTPNSTDTQTANTVNGRDNMGPAGRGQNVYRSAGHGYGNEMESFVGAGNYKGRVEGYHHGYSESALDHGHGYGHSHGGNTGLTGSEYVHYGDGGYDGDGYSSGHGNEIEVGDYGVGHQHHHQHGEYYNGYNGGGYSFGHGVGNHESYDGGYSSMSGYEGYNGYGGDFYG